MSDVTVIITRHAYNQYCKRVEQLPRSELIEQCQQQFNNDNYSRNSGNWIHLDGVWWIVERYDQELIFVTCYGKTEMDVPRALAWASRNNDRIDITQMI